MCIFVEFEKIETLTEPSMQIKFHLTIVITLIWFEIRKMVNPITQLLNSAHLHRIWILLNNYFLLWNLIKNLKLISTNSDPHLTAQMFNFEMANKIMLWK